ncbi:MAG: VWA domain-containing protein [Chloroflexi bacterium]|nr:VWA domain-containing protein [Chloroflexota bacterium]
MTFLQPSAFAFLLILPLIILLHLLRERRRRMQVSSLLLWRFLEPDLRGTQLRRFSPTLLLLLHLLVAGCLVLALAQPFLARTLSFATPSHTAIILDITTSMAAQDIQIAGIQPTSRFVQAKNRAHSIIAGLQGTDSVALITLEPHPRLMGIATMAPSSSALNRESLLADLDQLSPGGTGADLASALALANGTVNPDHSNRILVLTDGAMPAAKQTHIPGRLSAPVEWQIIGTQVANQALVAFASRPLPDGGSQLFARVANFSASSINRTLRLQADGQTIYEGIQRLPPEGAVENVWTIPPGTIRIQGNLLGNDALPEDDQAVLYLATRNTIQSVLVTENAPALHRALAAMAQMNLILTTPQDYPRLVEKLGPGSVDLTIFDGYLPKELPPGGVLLINPPNLNIGSNNPTGSLVAPGGTQVTSPGSLSSLLATDPLLQNVDLSSVQFGRAATPSAIPGALPAWAQPIYEINGRPLIFRGTTGVTQVIGLAFDLASSNLPSKLAFPLLLANAVAELTPPLLPESILAGQIAEFPAGTAGNLLHVRDPEGHTTLLPAEISSVAASSAPGPTLTHRTIAFSDTRHPGFYQVSAASPAGTKWTSTFAVNAGADIESDLRSQPMPAIAPELDSAALGAANPASAADNNQQPFWPWLAWATLAILLIEIIYNRSTIGKNF